MISALLRFWGSLPFTQSRAKRLPGLLRAHVPPGADVLDVGSGNGDIARHLALDGPARSVVGVDVVLQPNPAIEVRQFDGDRLPFESGAFDVVTLVDVLHHCRCPRSLLAEALRVASDRVIVKDHYWRSGFDYYVLCLSDYLGNKAYGIPMTYSYLRLEQWTALFEGLGYANVSGQKFRYATYDLCKQVIFVLAPAPAPSGD